MYDVARHRDVNCVRSKDAQKQLTQTHFSNKTHVYSLTFDSGLTAVIFAKSDEGVIPEMSLLKLNLTLFNKHFFTTGNLPGTVSHPFCPR